METLKGVNAAIAWICACEGEARGATLERQEKKKRGVKYEEPPRNLCLRVSCLYLPRDLRDKPSKCVAAYRNRQPSSNL